MTSKKIVQNLILFCSTVVIFILFLEFIIFRFVFVATDMPELDFVNGVVKYMPGQEGVYRIKDEIKARYKINENGWNSAYDRYIKEKRNGIFRIAIVGDSYVEATEVDYNKSLAERLEEKLGREKYQVYRFGISGAPLSQYLHIIRKDVAAYMPDLLVLIVVHNDFDESYLFLEGTYGSNFMKFSINNNSVKELPPQRLVTPWYSFIRGSATWRFLIFRQKLPYSYLKDIILGNNLDFQANISTASVKWARKNRIATDYAFGEIQKICKDINADLLILMNGVMEVVYGKASRDDSLKNGALVLNNIARDAAFNAGIDFMDLEPVFETDYHKHHKRFTFVNDGHWNEYGHEIVAKTISAYIQNEGHNK